MNKEKVFDWQKKIVESEEEADFSPEMKVDRMDFPNGKLLKFIQC